MTRKSKKQRRERFCTHCAGGDIGSREYWVGLDPRSCEQPVWSFTTFTDDPQALAQWLKSLVQRPPNKQ